MTTHSIRRLMPFLVLPFIGAAAPALSPASSPVHGQYVEVRTASVFAGACHYNGERVTEGKSAVLAWKIEGGSFNGTDLSGVKVLAAVACDDNLAEAGASRSASIIVDADTEGRAEAATAWVKSSIGGELGRVVRATRAPVAFNQSGETFTVAATGFASLSVRAMPDHACCSQPQLVWYHPLMPLTDRRVGYTESAKLEAAAVGLTWQRADENSAFYGHFAR